MKRTLTILLLAGLASALAINIFSQTNTMNPDPKTSTTELATFGGGCFWCTEAMFQTIKGVNTITSGYAGGKVANPTYEEVCSGATGHAEVIQIAFDPREVSFAHLMDVFWDAHDPTSINAQGADHGTQYRSIILYANEAQRAAAESSKKRAQAKFNGLIVTEIVPLVKFYPAEGYHQNYFSNHPNAPYCAAVIKPKLEKFKHATNKP